MEIERISIVATKPNRNPLLPDNGEKSSSFKMSLYLAQASYKSRRNIGF